MSIAVGEISFGELDAKNEVIEQERLGISIFYNSFITPPGIDLNALTSGAKCFIYGQKGCGKTALLLYIRKILEDRNAKTRTILFKSGITEPERQKIVGTNFQLVEQNGVKFVDHDFKINWLWYIYRNIFRLISQNEVCENWDIALSLRKILGVHNEVNTSVLADLALKRIKILASAGMK